MQEVWRTFQQIKNPFLPPEREKRIKDMLSLLERDPLRYKRQLLEQEKQTIKNLKLDNFPN